MKMKKNKKQKTFSAVSVFWISCTIFVNIFPHSAEAASLPVPSLSMPSLSGPVGISDNGAGSSIIGMINNMPDSLKMANPGGVMGEGDIGSIAAAGNRKLTGPKMDILFSSSGPIKPGTLVAASATPSGFSDQDDKIFFTWYIKHADCGLSKTLNADNRQCDLDGDSKITVNDWKIEAARINADGTFDSKSASYNNVSTEIQKGSGALANPSITDKDKGWVTNFLRKANGDLYTENSDKDEVDKCYIMEPSSGISYELREGGDAQFNPCPAGYSRACVDNMAQTCETTNPLYSATDDAANQQAISDAIASGNPPPARYNVPQTIKWGAQSCNVTAKTDNNTTEAPDGMKCNSVGQADNVNFSTQARCDSGKAICVKNNSNTPVTANIIASDSSTDPLLYGTIWDNNICSAANASSFGVMGINGDSTGNIIDNIWKDGFTLFPEQSTDTTFIDASCSTLTEDIINGVKDDSGDPASAGNQNMKPTCTRSGGGVNTCKHLFPYFPKENVVVDGTALDMTNEIMGDGYFSSTEKAFWKTDPTKVSTSGQGVDEAVVMGLGMKNFSWTYEDGDQIGVVAEGDSALYTAHIDASKKRMWAFSKNICPDLSSLTEDGAGSYYVEKANGNEVGIITANFDVNECLEDNLIDPVVSSTPIMDVKLTSSKEEPLNDASGQGDKIKISAAVQNSVNAENLFYDWHIEKSLDGSFAPTNNTDWEDITLDMQNTYKSFAEETKSGLGKKSFQLDLNMPKSFIEGGMNRAQNKGYFYLRIRAKVAEKEGDKSQSNDGLLTLKVYEQKNEVLTYSTTADIDGKLRVNSDGLLCNDATGKIKCGVTQNEIVALRIPNDDRANVLEDFSWKINGVIKSCNTSFSTSCVLGGNLLFLPIIGKEGDAIKVEVAAINKNTNGHIAVERNFQIVAPQVAIVSSDVNKVWPKTKGYFKQLDGTSTPDYSTTNFQTFASSDRTVRAVFYPSWKENQSDFDWTVDGISFGQHNQKEIVLPSSGQAGDNQVISINVEYKPGTAEQISNIRKALQNNWGVALTDSVEKSDKATIQVDIVPDDVVAMGGASLPWTANLLSHVPEQVLFSLRIILTGMLLLFVTSLVFSFMPETEKR